MHPILFKIPLFGGIPIYSYGVMYATAFLAGLYWSTREAKRLGVNTDFILDLSFYIILASIVGGRLVFILVGWEHYVAQPWDILKLWQGGFVFYGGLICALLVGWVYAKKRGYGFFEIGDLMIPGLALGHVFGRLGCFFAGCCYGRPVEGSFFPSITFPFDPTSLALQGIPLYPTQLMESLANLCIFLVLFFLTRHKKFTGQVFIAYIILYAVMRSTLEFFRGDDVRGYVIPHWLTTSQFISLALVAGAVASYLWLRKRASKRT